MGKGEGGGQGSGAYKGKTERFYIPAMPLPAAIVCCILNFLIPGFGTIVAGFSNFCCSRNEDFSTAPRVVSCVINVGIGLLQLATTALCFIGWFWSCMWGGFYIVTSSEYYHNNHANDVDHHNEVVITQQPEIQAVYPYPGATRPECIIIRPQHVPFAIVPGPNDTGNVNPGFSKDTSSSAQETNQNDQYGGEDPPPYPGPPTAPPYSP